MRNKTITTVTTAPTVEPVTLAEVKSFLRVYHALDDSTLTYMIAAAVRNAEAHMQRKVIDQTLATKFESFPDDERIVLPWNGVSSITSIAYTDASGNAGTVSSDDYSLVSGAFRTEIALGYGKIWPTAVLQNVEYPVVVTYQAGWLPTSDSPADERGNVPSDVKTAIMIMVELLYDRPTGGFANQIMTARDNAWRALLEPYTITRF